MDNGRRIEHHMYSGGMGRFERDCVGGLRGNWVGVCTNELAGFLGWSARAVCNIFARQQKTDDFDAIWSMDGALADGALDIMRWHLLAWSGKSKDHDATPMEVGADPT